MTIWYETGGGSKQRYSESISTVDVTPDMAMEWIAAAWAKYPNGRNFYPTQLSKIRQYAESMATGQWEWTPEQPPVVIQDGLVVDGRHRLHAILLSHQTVKCNLKTKRSDNGSV